MTIKVINTCAEMSAHTSELSAVGKTVGIVPTMGALHAGHLSLVEQAQSDTDHVVVTIFVNPTQFAPGEDLDQYPQPFEEDLAKLEALGVPVVFAPSREEMYPADCTTTVTPAAISQWLEGEFRPTHFGGVATIVLKLFNIVGADKAFFGQKDFQQVMVVKKMVDDLNVPIEIVSCPIVRETDGLAMSSRNVYLSEKEREQALALSQTLEHVRKMIVDDGDRDGHVIMGEMRQMLIDGGVDSIDYAVIANPSNLEVLDTIQLPAVALVAAHVGSTRLIDNLIIE